MSERYKLQKDWEFRTMIGKTVTPMDMLLEMAQLVQNCPHNKTHWIQELTKEGVLTEKIFKRCYLCGYNIEEIELNDNEFLEKILSDFDKAVEEKKLSLTQKESKGEN